MRDPSIDWDEKFSEWTFGDRAATEFLSGLFAVIHLWDDLIDRDKPVSEETINRTFFWLVAEMPRNEFFIAFGERLSWSMQICATQWLACNRMERSGNDDLVARAYGLRDSAIEIVVQVACFLGGYDHAMKVSEEIYALSTSETLDEYRKSING